MLTSLGSELLYKLLENVYVGTCSWIWTYHGETYCGVYCCTGCYLRGNQGACCNQGAYHEGAFHRSTWRSKGGTWGVGVVHLDQACQEAFLLVHLLHHHHRGEVGICCRALKYVQYLLTESNIIYYVGVSRLSNLVIVLRRAVE